MTKEAFIEALAEYLDTLPPGELNRAIGYYEEIIDDGMEEGLTEEEAVGALGDPKELADQLLSEFGAPDRPVKTALSDDRPLSGELTSLRIDTRTIDVELHAEIGVEGVKLDLIGVTPDEIETVLVDGAFTLTEKETPARRWFSFGTRRVDIAVGRAPLEKIQWRSARGDGQISRIECAAVSIHLEMGDLNIENVVCRGLMELQTRNGDMEIRGLEAGALRTESFFGDTAVKDARCESALDIRVKSGDVEIGSSACEGPVTVATASGDVSLRAVQGTLLEASTMSGDLSVEGSRWTEARVKTASGDVEFGDVTVSGALNVAAVSGDISVHGAEALSMTLQTTSGDIEAVVEPAGEYRFDAHSRSGDVDVPRGAGSRPVSAHSTSGDISIEED